MKLMVIDGNSIVNRAFYGVAQTLTTREGQPTGAILGFLNILNKLLDENQPDGLCITFDRRAPTFRHLAYEGYKAQRKGMPDELASQMPLLKSVLSAMNIPQYEMDGWEADDLMGTIARIDEERGWETIVVTGDKDSLQLVTDKTTVHLVSSRMGRTTTKQMTPAAFQEEYGFPPRSIVDLKAIMGDASDNIPGVKGVGEKTAMSLVQQCNTLDAIYENLEGWGLKPGMLKKMAEGREGALMSYDLATIRRDAPLDFSPQDSIRAAVDNDALYQLFLDLEFSKLITKYNLTAPHGEGSQETETSFSTTCTSEVVETGERMESLLALFETLPHVSMIALPNLDGVAVCWKEGESRCAALFFSDKLGEYPLFLQKFFGNTIKKIAHSTKELCRQLLSEGLPAEAFLFDTEVAAYLLAPTDGSYDLPKLGMAYLSHSFPPASDYTDEGAFGALADPALPIATLLSHCALIHSLYEMLSQKMELAGLSPLYFEVELPLCLVLAEMELAGISVDRGALNAMGDTLAERISALQSEIYALAGEEFNVNSPKQLGVILFEKLGLTATKKTKTGYSTNAEVLEKLRSAHPIVPLLLEYRQLSKLKSTYTDGLAKVIAADGRIHSCFQNTVTATGRLSSTEPNLQNIPIRTELGAKLRYMFVAEGENLLVDADYSQIELRLLAHMAEDEAMIGAFQSGEDIHTATAAQVFGVPADQVTPHMRRSAKAVNFGIVYGISPFSLSQDIGVTVAEAKLYMEKYFETYSGVRRYMDAVVVEAKERGYVQTLMGRRRWVPELSSSNFNTRSFGERIALNMPIQGTAADVMKLAMVRVRNRLRAENLQSRMILQVHDEIIVEAPPAEGELVKKLVKEEMEGVASYAVPLLVEAASGKNWGEAH